MRRMELFSVAADMSKVIVDNVHPPTIADKACVFVNGRAFLTPMQARKMAARLIDFANFHEGKKMDPEVIHP